MLLDIVTVAVVVFFGVQLVRTLRHSLAAESRQRSIEIVRGLRLRHFVPVPFVLAAIVAAAVALYYVPGLWFGWWTAIGGQGNPVFGTTERTAGTPLELIIPAVFIVLLVPALPRLVEVEEQLFRLGAEQWSNLRRAWKALLFGLVHALIGIPIAFALALTIGGLYFTVVYVRAHQKFGTRRAAFFESTRAHLAYDVVVVALVVAALFVAG